MQLSLTHSHSGDVAARLDYTFHETKLDGIYFVGEHDRDCGRRSPCSKCHVRAAWCSDDCHSAVKEISHQLRHQLVSSFCPAVFDCDALALRVAGFIQTLPKGSHTIIGGFGGPGADQTNHRLRRLLRPRRERPRRSCAAEQRDELAPPHVRFRARPPVRGWEMSALSATGK